MKKTILFSALIVLLSCSQVYAFDMAGTWQRRYDLTIDGKIGGDVKKNSVHFKNEGGQLVGRYVEPEHNKPGRKYFIAYTSPSKYQAHVVTMYYIDKEKSSYHAVFSGKAPTNDRIIGCWFDTRGNAGDLEMVRVTGRSSGSVSHPRPHNNWNFENGTLNGWTSTGNAFNTQPTYGDNPTARHRGQPSKHQGNYWIGGYENCSGPNQTPGAIQGDGPQGTLTSRSFTIRKDNIRFLIGGGCDMDSVRAELIINGQVVRQATGNCTETMHEEAWDVSAFRGQNGQIRLVDNAGGGWGHINFDDVRFTD